MPRAPGRAGGVDGRSLSRSGVCPGMRLPVACHGRQRRGCVAHRLASESSQLCGRRCGREGAAERERRMQRWTAAEAGRFFPRRRILSALPPCWPGSQPPMPVPRTQNHGASSKRAHVGEQDAGRRRRWRDARTDFLSHLFSALCEVDHSFLRPPLLSRPRFASRPLHRPRARPRAPTGRLPPWCIRANYPPPTVDNARERKRS